MSGERKAVGPVRKELQGFRVLHQSLEAERCNSLLSDDPTVSSPGSLVCRLASVVSKSSSRSSRIRRSPRLSLVSPTRIRGSLSTRSFIPSGTPGSPRQDPRTTHPLPYAARRAHRACTGLCLYTNAYLLVTAVV